LNPPFTCRGGRTHGVRLESRELQSSLSLAFVLTALQYVCPGGEMVAVLPAGSLDAEKDLLAWREIDALCERDVLCENGRRTFSGCFPRTCVVHFTLRGRRRRQGPMRRRPTVQEAPEVRVTNIIRGTLPVHLARDASDGDGLPFVHSTDLVNGDVVLGDRVCIGKGRCIAGPAVLLPRVGLPSATKICVYGRRDRIQLSDCVIGIICRSQRVAGVVADRVRNNWALFDRCYTGTCARYITLSRLKSALAAIAIGVAT